MSTMRPPRQSASGARSSATACAAAGVTATILAEPGRSIVAAAAVTLTVGMIKEIEVRTYVPSMAA